MGPTPSFELCVSFRVLELCLNCFQNEFGDPGEVGGHCPECQEHGGRSSGQGELLY